MLFMFRLSIGSSGGIASISCWAPYWQWNIQMTLSAYCCLNSRLRILVLMEIPEEYSSSLCKNRSIVPLIVHERPESETLIVFELVEQTSFTNGLRASSIHEASYLWISTYLPKVMSWVCSANLKGFQYRRQAWHETSCVCYNLGMMWVVKA